MNPTLVLHIPTGYYVYFLVSIEDIESGFSTVAVLDKKWYYHEPVLLDDLKNVKWWFLNGDPSHSMVKCSENEFIWIDAK